MASITVHSSHVCIPGPHKGELSDTRSHEGQVYPFFISKHVKKCLQSGREIALRHINKYIKSESKIKDLASYSPQ